MSKMSKMKNLSQRERNELVADIPGRTLSPAECLAIFVRYEATLQDLEEHRDHEMHLFERLKGEQEAALQEIRRLSDALGFYAKNWDTWGRIAKRALGNDGSKS